jgi:uncharacterized protein with ATP-grasp and redox domains
MLCVPQPFGEVPLKASLECLECFTRQALRAARIASNDPEVHRRVLDEVCRRIPTMNLDQTPPELSLFLYEINAQYSGQADPYLAQKRAQNALALGLEEELRALVRNSEDPLVTALHIAAAGNVIDLGTHDAHDIDVRGAIASVMRERFAIDHSAAFRDSLARGNHLLYLCDNAGEIVFDKILIGELLQHTEVTAVVKSGPIINDALMADAESVGLTALCPVIELGGPYVGTPLPLLSEDFKARMAAADVIIAKGQGNYETLDEYRGDVYLMLRAKCEVVARHMGVPLGQVVLISNRVRLGLG